MARGVRDRLHLPEVALPTLASRIANLGRMLRGSPAATTFVAKMVLEEDAHAVRGDATPRRSPCSRRAPAPRSRPAALRRARARAAGTLISALAGATCTRRLLNSRYFRSEVTPWRYGEVCTRLTEKRSRSCWVRRAHSSTGLPPMTTWTRSTRTGARTKTATERYGSTDVLYEATTRWLLSACFPSAQGGGTDERWRLPFSPRCGACKCRSTT